MKYWFMLIVSCFALQNASAQSFEDYKKQQQKELKAYEKEVEEGMNKLQAEFDSFVKKRNEEFATFLKDPWKSFDLEEGEEAPADPKPIEKPTFKPNIDDELIEGNIKDTLEFVETEKKAPLRQHPPQRIVGKPVPIMQESTNPIIDVEPRISVTPKSIPNARVLQFTFYGQNISMEADPKLYVSGVGPVDENKTSEFWARFTNAQYDPLIEQLLYYTYILNLNDWGLYQLALETSKYLSQGDENTARLTTWVLLNQAGFKTRVGYYEGIPYLLVPFKQKVYDRFFVDLKGVRYYIMENQTGQIFTYPEDFGGAFKTLDLNVYQPLSFEGDLKTKTYVAPTLDHDIEIPVNPHAVELYNSFPPSELNVYFNAGLTADIKDAIHKNLAPMLKNKSEQEQVQILLSFVQHAFEYQVDQEQFHREKAFFPDEIFFYPYSDCEDRSILFSYLVRSLIGLDVVGLDYPGHIATAVAFSTELNGDYYEYKGKKFTVCDPTYIGAPIGATMPQFKNVSAGIIMTENVWKVKQVEENIWRKLSDLGCMPGGTQNIVRNDQDEFYACGWFENNILLNGMNIQSQGGKDIFVAKFDASAELQWLIPGGGKGADIPASLYQNKTGGVFMSGSFSHKITLDGKTAESSQSDMFLTQVSSEGDVQWISTMQLKHADDGKNLAYVGKFSQEGKRISTNYYPESGRPYESGITQINDYVYLAGAFNSSAGLRKSDQDVTNDLNSFDYVELIKTENDQLVHSKYEKNIAAVFSVLNVLENNGTLIAGETAQEALDKYNPSFRKQNEDLYESLGLVDFLRNSDGMIVVKTNATKGVNFDMLKMSNNSSMKICNLPDGNAKIEFISGVKVGKAFVWFQLNHILLEHQTGDLIFDYDKDHTRKRVNFKKEVLGI